MSLYTFFTTAFFTVVCASFFAASLAAAAAAMPTSGATMLVSYPYVSDHWSAKASSKLTACRLDACA